MRVCPSKGKLSFGFNSTTARMLLSASRSQTFKNKCTTTCLAAKATKQLLMYVLCILYISEIGEDSHKYMREIFWKFCSKVWLLKVEFSGLSGDDTKVFMVLVRSRHLKTTCLFFGHRKHWLKIKGVTLCWKVTRGVSARGQSRR